VNALQHDLQVATTLRALSLMLRAPSADLKAQLEALAEPLVEDHRQALLALARLVPEDLEQHYHRHLGPGGDCPTGESDYVPQAAGSKGAVLADVAGFYRAFRFDASAEMPECPDHVAIELSFLSWLHFKQAHALHEAQPDNLEICRDAVARFKSEHLDLWLSRFLDRLEAISPVPFYAHVARFSRACLSIH